MAAKINVDRHRLIYCDGRHRLELYVEWCSAKMGEIPIDFEITAGDLDTWTEPAGEPIEPATRESLLDEIAEYYSKGPIADIIGKHGALLRGVSKFRFCLHIYPTPSHYYEVGRFLAIPMIPTPKNAGERFVLDLSAIDRWTEPKLPLPREYLEVIAARIRRDSSFVTCSFRGLPPKAQSQVEAKGHRVREFMRRWF